MAIGAGEKKVGAMASMHVVPSISASWLGPSTCCASQESKKWGG